jgi:PAS domain S-box-containing protein
MIKKSKPLYYAVSVFAVGLTLTLLSLYLDKRSSSLYQEKAPYLKLGETVIAAADAGYAKISAGGTLDDATRGTIETARKLVQDAYEGNSNSLGAFREKDDDLLLALRTTSLELDEALHAIQAMQELRNSGTEEGMAALVAKASLAFQKASSQMDTVVKNIERSVETGNQMLALFFRVTTALLIIAFASLSIFVYRIQKNKEKIEADTTEKLAREEDRMQQLTAFIEAVSNGNYEFALAAAEEGDHVTETLVRMREKLKENAELESRRNWATSGLAQIGEILRGSGSSTELLDNIIKFIVKYTNSNQGGLFILNDNDSQNSYLELQACYAFERKRYLTKVVSIGNGLVGQCFLEKEKTYLQEIPEEYVNITSGLGGATPKSILVVPLKVNEDVFGVLELASFHSYEDHEIELIEKFSESIAATVSSVKVNERTRELLEQTQQQAEEMKAQEEEMRQNMEELSATQEQLQRQMMESEKVKEEMTQRNYVFGLNTILSEADKFGTITHVNEKLTRVSKYSREELIGKGHNIFRHPDMPKELFRLMWDTIQRGNTFSGVVKNRAKDGTHYWVDATIVPIFDKEGKLVKYIGARYHITNDRLAEALYQRQLETLGLGAEKTAS